MGRSERNNSKWDNSTGPVTWYWSWRIHFKIFSSIETQILNYEYLEKEYSESITLKKSGENQK